MHICLFSYALCSPFPEKVVQFLLKFAHTIIGAKKIHDYSITYIWSFNDIVKKNPKCLLYIDWFNFIQSYLDSSDLSKTCTKHPYSYVKIVNLNCHILKFFKVNSLLFVFNLINFCWINEADLLITRKFISTKRCVRSFAFFKKALFKLGKIIPTKTMLSIRSILTLILMNASSRRQNVKIEDFFLIWKDYNRRHFKNHWYTTISFYFMNKIYICRYFCYGEWELVVCL